MIFGKILFFLSRVQYIPTHKHDYNAKAFVLGLLSRFNAPHPLTQELQDC